MIRQEMKKLQIKVTYTKDWEIDDLNEGGTITIDLGDNRCAKATWETVGGKGTFELVDNNTGMSDIEVYKLLDNPDICQGYGTYEVELTL